MKFPPINFPTVEFRIKKIKDSEYQIFDDVRKKFVVLTPEEWVRQHLVHYLINHKQIPVSLISIEKQLIFNGMKRRTDLIVYSNSLIPLLIVECKEPNVDLSQNAVNQIYNYNSVLNVPNLLITNGIRHICLKQTQNKPVILNYIPDFSQLNQS